MKRVTLLAGATALVIVIAPCDGLAQQPQAPRPFYVGNRLGLPVEPGTDGAFEPISSNVKVYGAIYSAESCSYDPERGVIVVPNRGVPQNVQTNNAWVSFINHDGSVHTARWIGVQSPADRANLTPPLVLNEPYGSDIANGMLYVADRDGGTSANDTSVAVVRRFDMRTGAPAGEFRVERSTWFNDIAVAGDGTVYATQTGDRSANPDPSTWQVWKITPNGSASIFVQGAPLRWPNGVAIDPQGNIVVVNTGNADVVTFSPAGKLLKTETAAQAGSDGLVIMRDGTKYVSSVLNGGVSRIRPGKPGELIARNIPSAASMCYDAGANQLVIPMNANNALALIRIDRADAERDLANPATAFVNGRWFDGTDFRTRTMYSVDGVFVASLPGKPDTVVDLAGAYVVPPFADAHNHNVEFYGDARARAVLAKYLDAGVFYDQNPLTLERARAGMTGLVNVPTGVDVTWAVGGLTGSGGHPSGLFLRNLKAGVFTEADGEGGFFFAIDSLSDLDRKWPAFLERRPDFVKTFLLYSEEYAKRRGDSTYFNWRGMNPAVLPEVVRRAHARGLRVMTHIETAADFHNALVAGVDEIGHMPGFRGNEHVRLPDIGPYIIADEDAAFAAKHNVVVVTTLQQGAAFYTANGPDSIEHRQFERLNARNLGTLKRHGVRLAIGSDNYRETSVPEARYLASVGVFSNLEVLRMWSETTPLAIFPRRKIGRLVPGYEASFLVLDGNPLVDFANTGRIRLRVKQGHIL